MIVVKCECGAITINNDEGDWSMTVETFEREFPDLEQPTRPQYGNCNHCVNHWGIDLCGCGSGEPVGECDGDFDQCKTAEPFQTLDVLTMSSVE